MTEEGDFWCIKSFYFFPENQGLRSYKLNLHLVLRHFQGVENKIGIAQTKGAV